MMTRAFAEVLDGSHWLIEPNAMRALLARSLATTGGEIERAQDAVAGFQDRLAQPTMAGDVAVISMAGPIVYKMSWFAMLFGCASIEMMRMQFRTAIADPAVKTIVFRCDTPGGVVDMVPEFADEVYAARGPKQILFVADTMIASAGYWLAAQGDAIYATRSSHLGSIGVYTQHEDISVMLDRLGVKITLIAHPDKKIEGNPFEPLAEAAKQNIQAQVDEIGLEFEAAVMRGRGVSRARVLEWTQLGVPPRGKRAIEIGLADKVGTFDGLLAKLTKGRAAGSIMTKASVPVVGDVAIQAAADAAKTPTVAAKADETEKADTVAPNEDGTCPADYEKGDDGQCHLPDDSTKADQAAAVQQQLDADNLAVLGLLLAE